MTVVLYALLVFAGWISIYAASYDFDYASIFDYAERSGKQLLWIGLAFVMAFMILMVEARVYETYAYLIYVILIVLLAATIFLAPDIKGSPSWLKLGPVSLQPAEFAKFATSLALARLFSTYNFVLTKPANFIRAVIIIVLPILLIMMQKETGSALVYTALVFVLYREGMSGMVLFGGFCAVLYFVVGLKYSDVMWGASSLGETIVLIFISKPVCCAWNCGERVDRCLQRVYGNSANKMLTAEWRKKNVSVASRRSSWDCGMFGRIAAPGRGAHTGIIPHIDADGAGSGVQRSHF